MHPLVQAELEGRGDGVPFRAQRHHVHRTWARTFASLPELYIQPQTLPELEKLVSLARRCRKRLVTAGCGHSPSNITCTSSWLVNLDNFNKVLSVDKEAGSVTVQAGIRLYTLCEELDKLGLAMPNLGSINEQSIAGAISTGTHGSSIHHGLMSEDIMSLKITLADGTTRFCSPEENVDLYRAGLLSLGALGIISEVTVRAVPAFKLKWKQVVDSDKTMLNAWDKDLWTLGDFVRVWWFPYTRRAVTWQADKTEEDERKPATSYYDGSIGYYVYHNLLFLAHFIPRLCPWVEWFVFGMQYGFKNGTSSSAVQPSRQALLLNCLYSQYVNEWAIPLEKGPEALRRLGSWLNRLQPGDEDYVPHGIPFSAENLYVHAPVEVRVSDTTLNKNPRPFLDPTSSNGPTLYLNAIMYRPYWWDPPATDRYYQGFEYLMKDLGGRPHWAKNFHTYRPEIEAFFGKDLEVFRKVRDEVDPEGMFVGPWHRERIMAAGQGKLELEEVETVRKAGTVGGWTVWGQV